MIVVTLALVPYGIGTPSRLAYMKISNQANNPRHPRFGNYKVEFYTKTNKLHRTVFVNDYARKSKPIFELLSMAMIEYKKAEKEDKKKRKDAKISSSTDRNEQLPSEVQTP